MLKKRICAVVIVRDGLVVQSIRFHRYLPVGRPVVALEYLTRWGADEIVLLDITASRRGRAPDRNLVRSASARCHVPLTVGGGISSIEDIRGLMRSGADKVAMNQAILRNPGLVREAAETFGSQCVVASIDGIRGEQGHRVYDHAARQALPESPAELAGRAAELGAGEILINSVDRDGTREGYDHDLVAGVCAAVPIPVIACGGARNGGDLARLLRETGVSAAAAANYFHFTEHSINVTKAVAGRQANLRVEGLADYRDASIDADMRLQKKDDARLEEMLYARAEPEVI